MDVYENLSLHFQKICQKAQKDFHLQIVKVQLHHNIYLPAPNAIGHFKCYLVYFST